MRLQILFFAIAFFSALKATAVPIAYFTFASDANIVLRQDLNKIASKTGGNLMVGGDAGYPDISAEFVSVMRKADSVGAKKHVYLEGPGGPTGSGGIAGDECQRMMKRARAVGISIDKNSCASSNRWVKEWNRTGWWASSKAEIQYFNSHFGAVSFEIDNLYRAGIESSSSVVTFVRRFQSAMRELNLPATLLLKNVTVEDLNAIRADINGTDGNRIQRAFLTDFMISEEDFRGDWPSITAAAKKIGIKMLKSSNTNNYQARGYWN